MHRFWFTLISCLMMALLLPYTDMLAVSDTSPTYTHFVYLVGHASWLHYAVNAWTLLVFHNLFKIYRVIAAYLCAVIISYTLLPSQPMVGASVFNCFFMGFWSLYLWYREKLGAVMTVALLILTCLLPGFAGIQHVAAFITGLLFSYAEKKVWHAISFLKF